MQSIGQYRGWTFDPSDESWFARTGPNTWSVVKGAIDDPPSWAPQA